MENHIDTSSTIEKLCLLSFICAIIIGNICVLVTYFIHNKRTHWSDVFVLCMAFIDIFIGSFVLPMRYVSVYGTPLNAKLCAALSIGESCAIASSIHLILLMIYTRLLNLKQLITNIKSFYLLLIFLIISIAFFLFYGIPFMKNYSNYFSNELTLNTSSYCISYIASIYHPFWMSYIECGIIYLIPLLAIFLGLYLLLYNLCQTRTQRHNLFQRKTYLKERRLTWHMVILSLIFVCLWLPWIVLRILFIFYHSKQIQHALQVTYYVLVFKSVCFPILYASTNASYRCTFAIYRKRRVTTNEHI